MIRDITNFRIILIIIGEEELIFLFEDERLQVTLINKDNCVEQSMRWQIRGRLEGRDTFSWQRECLRL